MQNNELLSSNAEIINVDTGEVEVTSRPAILCALALGSCVAVIAYNRQKKIGGLAHIMLPGRSTKWKSDDKMKYSEDAIDALLDAVKKRGSQIEDLELDIIGGANVLGEGDLPDKVVESILNYLKKLGIKPKSAIVGGTEQRSASLDIVSGRIFYTEGDSAAKEL